MKIEAVLETEEPMILRRAVLVYEGTTGACATVHHVLTPAQPNTPDNEASSEQGPPQIGPGQLLRRDTLETLVQALRGSSVVTGREVFPRSLLFCDESLLMWRTEPRVVPIYFSTADKAFNEAVHGKPVAHPPLLFIAEPGKLSVWALPHSTQRPDAKTPLYRAPYCNLYGDGAMCRGDVAYPGALGPSSIPAWERIFYESRFTHSNLQNGKMTNHPHGHHGLWREMAETKFERFKDEYLVPLPITVGDVLNGKRDPKS